MVRKICWRSHSSPFLQPHNSPPLDVSQHLDPNKDEIRKGLPVNMKHIPWGAKFDIPFITLESDR